MTTSWREQLARKGWCFFNQDQHLRGWVESSYETVRNCLSAPENQQWWRYENTWFAGVNVLPNDKTGQVAGGVPLRGKVIEFINNTPELEYSRWDRGQVSTCFKGYPKPDKRESEQAFGFRRKRFAAHIDGLLPEGPDKRRHLRELHAFILGIAMTDAPEDAAPFMVWEGSHQIIGQALQQWYGTSPGETWSSIDVTDAYHKVRREIFDRCRLVRLNASPGEAFLVHRHALHGTSIWPANCPEYEPGRMIVFFRPLSRHPHTWLGL